MELRAGILKFRDRTAGLFRAHVAPRPILAGGMAAALVGVLAGFGLSAGLVWEQTPQRAAVVRPERPPEPIRPMVDASGRVPDYVIGADHLRREPDPQSVVRVVGVPTPDRQALAEAREEAGERRWWAPWSWNRPDDDELRQRQVDRLAEAREAARAARQAARERFRQERWAYEEGLAEERYDARAGRRYAYEPEEERLYDYEAVPYEPWRRRDWND